MTEATYVALDLETTGLDPANDRITEVGAVRFASDGTIVEEFATLVNPGREIPVFVQTLTGVTNEAVRDAPVIASVAEGLRRFVGNGPIVGQNVQFDLAHLRQAGVVFDGIASIDTAELSRLLMPGRESHGLAGLAEALGVPAEEYHRALADARTAAAVFVALRGRAGELEPWQRLQLARLVSLHEPALAEVIGGDGWQDIPPDERSIPAIRPATIPPPLVRREPKQAVPLEELVRAFRAGPQGLSGFEQRAEQEEMAEAVRNAFNRGGHWLIEAGTGVGKSLAYLVPAALHALANGERVIISTNTHNLQEQLLAKDIPSVRRLLRAAGVIQEEDELRATVLKGRGNYLCIRRWIASYGAAMGDADFARLAAAMLLWLPTTDTGDRSELNIDRYDWTTWPRISAQDADCLARQNPYVRDGSCFLARARKAAESAHIVIVNHALLLADVASGGSALPPYDHLIIDEAHNLEDTATKQFGGTVSRRQLVEALEGIYRPGSPQHREGGVVTLLKAFPEGGITLAADALQQAVAFAVRAGGPAFESLAAFVPRGAEDDRVLLDRSLRAQPGWAEPETRWGELDRALAEVLSRATLAAGLLGSSAPVEEPDAIASEVTSAARRVADLRDRLEELMNAVNDDLVVWLARERDGSASVNAAPLDVGPTLWEELLSKKSTVIATSATLSAAGTMAYTARRLGFDEPGTLQLGSPFDYERSTLLAAFTDVPEPADPGYNDAVASAISALVRAADGRSMALFTSHSALRRAAERIRPELEADGFAVLVQGIDGNPRRLVEELRLQPRSVILGTASLWEGVDIKGDALSMLIIARLPFAVPSDPVYRARSEQYDRPFEQFALPSAILRFRQGFGRLIRDRQDRGVVAVLDRRIYEKRYGEDFVNALPRCTRYRGTTEAVALRAREWLGDA